MIKVVGRGSGRLVGEIGVRIGSLAAALTLVVGGLALSSPASASRVQAAPVPAASGTPGERVAADRLGTVNVAGIAQAVQPESPARSRPVPRGDGGPDPIGAPPESLVVPDQTPHGSAEAAATSPGLTATFAGPSDTGWAPPDTDGAVGPNHVVTAINGGFAIQTRTGEAVSQVTLTQFWASLLSSGAYPFDPRILYDRFNNRWITVAVDTPNSAASGLLVGVSTTSDPTGAWTLGRYGLGGYDNKWGDYPTLGFNRHWITVGLNMYQLDGTFSRPQVFAIDKMLFYGGGPGAGAATVWQNLSQADYGFTIMPATTHDNTTDTQYLARTWGISGNSGYLALHRITGTVDHPILSAAYAYPEATNAAWSRAATASNSAPQLGGSPVDLGNDRMHGLVFRGGELWAVHEVFLPAVSPTRAAVQWWNLTASTGAILQRGRIDSGSAATHYGYPSIAVNAAEDVLVGYSQFASDQYPSGNYSLRRASDPVNTMRAGVELKDGEANYVRFDGNSRNRWGDYSSTHVDPVNDTDLWTIQQYAESPSNTWGTWWGKVTPSAQPRPDGRIKVGSGTFVGNDTYNGTGLNQTRSGSAARGSSVTYTVKVQNDSLALDVLRLKGTGSNTAFSVTYTVGTTDITAAMVAGTYLTPTLAPGATVTIKVVVKVKATAPAGSSLTGTLTAKSNTDTTYKDTVKFVTRRA